MQDARGQRTDTDVRQLGARIALTVAVFGCGVVGAIALSPVIEWMTHQCRGTGAQKDDFAVAAMIAAFVASGVIGGVAIDGIRRRHRPKLPRAIAVRRERRTT